MSETLHLDAANSADIAHAAQILRENRLVAFPTETVYGLGANALSAEAVAGIFVAKKRPSWDPLIVHLSSAEQLPGITEIPDNLRSRIASLTKQFWPGPLTLLLPRNAMIPDSVTAGRPLVGVRVPAHPVARALLAAADLPIAAPSANLFGHTSPTTAAHVLDDLSGRIDAVLDGGASNIGVESTVLDPTTTPMMIYRPGAITAGQLTLATGIEVERFRENPDLPHLPESLPSPGVGIRHYAPRARLILVNGDADALDEEVNRLQQERPEPIGVMLPDGWPLPADVLIEPWASWSDSGALAARLFAVLRALDDRGATMIVCPLPERGGINDATLDRLYKAAKTQ